MQILVIDDSVTVRVQIRQHFQNLGHEVLLTATGEEAVALAVQTPPDMAIIDYSLPGMNGIDVMRRLEEAGVSCGIVMLTGSDEVDVAVQAMKEGAYDYVCKPYNLADLTTVVEDVFAEHSLSSFRGHVERTLRSSDGEKELQANISRVLEKLLENFKYSYGILYLEDGERECLTASGFVAANSEPGDFHPVPLDRKGDLRNRVFNARQIFSIKNIAGTPKLKNEFETSFKTEIQSVAFIPVQTKEKAIGVLVLAKGLKDPPVSREELRRLRNFINQAAPTLDHARRMAAIMKDNKEHNWQLRKAGVLQRSLLPQSYSDDRIHIQALWNPAKVVCGDFYNFYAVGRDRVDFHIGDVVGKGVQAAILMGHTVALFKQFRDLDSPSDILASVNMSLNENLSGSELGIVGTAFYGTYDKRNRVLYYATAAHPLPILCRNGKVIADALSAEGFPLGVVENLKLKQNYLTIEPGDVLFLYTDGVTDAKNLNQEDFGVDGLLNALEQGIDTPTMEMMRWVHNRVLQHGGPGADYDDITMLGISFPG